MADKDGWIKEGESYTKEMPVEKDGILKTAENEWISENSPVSEAMVNPGMGALGGAAVGAASKVVNPIVKKGLAKATDIIAGPVAEGAKPSVFRVQPSELHPTEKYIAKMFKGDVSGAKDAQHMKEAYAMMLKIKENEEKAKALARANAAFGVVPPPKAITEKVGDVVRSASSMLTPQPESMMGKLATGTGQMLGRSLAGAGAGYQGYDAWNRLQEGDIPGAAISTVGAIGSGLSLVPLPVTRFGGTAIGIGAEALNAYLDYLKNKAQQPPPQAQPQPQPQPQPAPQKMAQGGLVGGLNATYNMPMAGGASLSIGGPQQQPQFNPMVPGMADGGLASIGRETEEEKRRRMMRLGVSAQSLSPMQDRGPGAIPGSANPLNSGMPPGVAARMQLEKSMGPGQARMGASGVGMALPNQPGVKMMPGQVNVGYNMPLGQGNLDISAQRDINKQRPGMPQNYAANVNYTLPFAAGGYIKK
jgi:hypothetical protein